MTFTFCRMEPFKPLSLQFREASVVDTSVEDRSYLYVDSDGRVDVAKLITAYTHDEHARRADAYFSSVGDPWAHFLRKPFSILDETPGMLAGYSSILRMLEPRPDQVVVDFGCGTGWLSQALGLMGCRPVGLDISESALEIARKAVADHPYLRDRPVSFKAIGDGVIPMEDESADRIVCFDSFHHVADQAAWLGEFYRVLKPGGRIAFHEPGPHHSGGDGSQYEMRQHAVIENDIVIESIREVAYGYGFENMQLAMFLDIPIMMNIEDYNRTITEAPVDTLNQLGFAVAQAGLGRRIFVMTKPGDEELDSRFRHAFSARVDGTITAHEHGSTAIVRLTNTGSGAWRTSGASAGSVNLAAFTFLEGRALNPDPYRYQIVTAPVPPGGHLDVTVNVPHPPGASVKMDMVSELVAWSSQNGGTALG